MAVEAIENHGSMLVVVIPPFIPAIQSELLDDTSIPVVPGEVAQYIRLAIQAGWKPAAAGGAFHLDANVSGSIRYADSFDLALNMVGDVLIAHIMSRGQNLTLFVDDITDAAGDLVDTVLSLVKSPGPETNASVYSCRWQAATGEWRWVLHGRGERVQINMLRFDDTFSSLPNEKGEPVFQTECSVVLLASQIQKQMHRLLSKYGETGYREQWGYRFPTENLPQLERAIQVL